MVKMLPDLLITGFRAFKHLEIEKLARVNLITGKNNSGKSCLLEALRLYASGGSPTIMLELLQSRDEGPAGFDALSVVNFFHGRKAFKDINLRIEIGPGSSAEERLIMEAAWWHEAAKERVAKFAPGYAPALFFGFDKQRMLILSSPLKKDPFEAPPRLTAEYVRPNGLSDPNIELMSDSVALTDLEDIPVEFLRIIAPEIARVSLVAPEQHEPRRPFVRVRGAAGPIPLRSLGDGMNRLFGIALAMVNARDGLLLVDEIENGVHYSVQSKLWNFIVQLAARLNVQVFATTHSWDCITAFQQAIREKDADGMLIRLEWRNGSVRAVEFTEDELAIAARESIEVR